MPQPDRDPLAATRRLLIDGSNLLHALSRTSGAAPPAALIGRLRGAIPAAVAIELVFDGPPERGLRNERIASGLTVRYSGPRTGDAVIIGLIDDVRLLDGADGTATLLVVTDDRDLRHGVAPARRADGRLGLAPRPAGRRVGCRRHRSGIRGRPAALARSARPARSTGIRPRWTARLEAGPGRDDQARQPATGPEGQRERRSERPD